MAGPAETSLFCSGLLQSSPSPALACLSLALCALGGAAFAWRGSADDSGLRRLLRCLSLGSLSAQPPPPAEPAKPPAGSRSAASLSPLPEWVAAIECQPGSERVMDADMLLDEQHPILEDDHMFASLVAQGLLQDLTGYYSREQQRFHAVVSLGRAVCGFPRVVHGGLTAAIIDESLGGLMFALKASGAVPPGPMFTVQLNISYQQKIEACSTVLCTCEVESQEGRKLWMKATVSNGPDGEVYATARALFVSPRPRD